MRLMECVRLRVKDLDLARQLTGHRRTGTAIRLRVTGASSRPTAGGHRPRQSPAAPLASRSARESSTLSRNVRTKATASRIASPANTVA